MPQSLAHAIAEAYRWQRRLGGRVIDAGSCHIVVSPAHPEVWDLNHADAVTAGTDAAIDDVFAAMERHLAHTPWRVVHTDGSTPDAFVARLAFEGFEERPLTIQMALRGEVAQTGAEIELVPVVDAADWDALLGLVIADHVEGRRTGGLALSRAFSASMVASYRAKGPAFHFHLAMFDGAPVAYGAAGLAPNGFGMIEDLFTLPAARRRGIATAMIAAFAKGLKERGATTIFLGALASETPKRLYRRLGFHPVSLARAWVREGEP